VRVRVRVRVRVCVCVGGAALVVLKALSAHQCGTAPCGVCGAAALPRGALKHGHARPRPPTLPLHTHLRAHTCTTRAPTHACSCLRR
jgi:hypothetical protein